MVPVVTGFVDGNLFLKFLIRLTVIDLLEMGHGIRSATLSNKTKVVLLVLGC